MKLTKIAFAVASVLSITSGVAMAGQIGSSSATLATEVIVNDAQVVRAPSKSYNFAGDVNAQTNEQRLQLQYTLSKGTWSVGAGNVITAADTLVDVSAANLLTVNYQDSTNANQTAFPAGTQINAFVTNSAKTLVLNVTIPVAGTNLLKTPIFTINSLGVTTTNNVGLTGLFTVAGATACSAPDQNLDVNFKHFTNHSGSAVLQTVSSPDSEHVRQQSTNDARLLNFTQNLDFQFAAASAVSRTDAGSLNRSLTGKNFATTAGNFTALAAATNHHYIGKVNLRQRSNGLDLNYTNTYGDSVAPFVPANPFIAADFDVLDQIGNLATGVVEMANLTVKLTVPTSWPTGTLIKVLDATGAATAIADVTTTAGQTDINVVATTAAQATLIANGVHLFAVFPGTILIPQTNGVAVTATLAKAPTAGTPDLREQNNVCTGTLTGIGGGIKIDVRNYASFAKFGATGPATTVRLINNSEGNAADVYGQLIYADGTYGPSGKLADLKPREVLNLSNKDIEALLTTAPAASNPFGAATSYTSTSGTAVVAGAAAKATMSDRLRIVSNTGTTLRVQSYMVVGNSVIDTSNAQGVDFENSGDRIPTNGLDAQPISQDAINGLSK